MEKNQSLCCDQKQEPKKRPRKSPGELLSIYTKALGHPARVQILELLKKKKSCVCGDIVNDMPLAQATVSQHLKVLKNAGFIKGTISGPAICYCINTETLSSFKKLVAKL